MAQAGKKATIYDAMEFPKYEYQEFPRMVYGANGAKRIVQNKEELAKAGDEGFCFDPQRQKPIKPAAPANKLGQAAGGAVGNKPATAPQ